MVNAFIAMAQKLKRLKRTRFVVGKKNQLTEQFCNNQRLLSVVVTFVATDTGRLMVCYSAWEENPSPFLLLKCFKFRGTER